MKPSCISTFVPQRLPFVGKARAALGSQLATALGFFSLTDSPRRDRVFLLRGIMVNDDHSTRANDSRRIDLRQGQEVRDWCESLGCTEESLRAAVRTVGNHAGAVREWLATGRKPGNRESPSLDQEHRRREPPEPHAH
jgi:hypothetical protein